MKPYKRNLSLKIGLGKERLNKILLDKALNAERIQRAEEDRTGAALNLVKAIKELQSIDLNQLAQYLDIVERLKGEAGGSERAKSRAGHVKSCLKMGDHPPRLNTRDRPIVNQYREGKAKRTPGGE